MDYVRGCLIVLLTVKEKGVELVLRVEGKVVRWKQNGKTPVQPKQEKGYVHFDGQKQSTVVH